MINRKTIAYAAFLTLLTGNACAGTITLAGKNVQTSIVYSKQGPSLDSIAAYLLQADILKASGYLPPVRTSLSGIKGNVVVIGNERSPLIQRFAGARTFFVPLRGRWECYGTKIMDHPAAGINAALLVAGSDARGTAYGVFSISEKIGVSPWYWWADVPVTKRAMLTVSAGDKLSNPPSVKYRGIFLNDEDWGLQPWAAKTFEPETGDIGPKTYAKIFELLLRLNANLIWPAMHPSTKAFYSVPGNKKVAADYHIVVGSSHAEPMLRNNVGEWNEKTMGPFNYLTNRDKVFNYWEQRVEEASGFDAIYTMGMRGVHDSGIEGVKTAEEAVPLVERIISDERGLLKKHVSPKVETVPQVFTAYKEVLEIYDSGLKLPEDITVVWPDDNYGYIQRLNSEQQKVRPGGSGIYYHASYWGRPHDYLWLSSTNPALIREEMMKAYDNGTNRLWVLNVGDLKPLEYNIQFFLDMAYNTGPFKSRYGTGRHRYTFAETIFGQRDAEEISEIWESYYMLAFERRPEFMGWSQTEPTTPTAYTGYNHFYYGDEAQRRINRYDELERNVKKLGKTITPDLHDAFYELVYYPVICAALMNKKFLYRDKSYLYGLQDRTSAVDYAVLSKSVYDSIRLETDYYNNRLALGKWKNMMSMAPRNLPVYLEPVIAPVKISANERWGVAPEGWINKTTSGEPSVLPAFQYYDEFYSQNKYFVDIFLSGNSPLHWTAGSLQNWVHISRTGGTLDGTPGNKDCRIWISIDWKEAPAGERLSGTVTIMGEDKRYNLAVTAIHPMDPLRTAFKGPIEENGYLSIKAANYTRAIAVNGEWEINGGLSPVYAALSASWSADEKNPACVEYDFYTSTGGTPVFNIYTLPSMPLNKTFGMRYRVRIDNGPLQEIDFKTVGRSEEWKQNVLRNSAIKQFTSQPLEKGQHTLKVYPLDPGIIFQHITADFGGLQKSYSPVPETGNKKFVLDR